MILKKLISRIALFGLILCIYSCVEPIHQYPAIAPGIWRATLDLSGVPDIEVVVTEDLQKEMGISKVELPFNFKVIYKNKKEFEIVIINGQEEIVLSEIQYGRDLSTANDTILIAFPTYDSYIQAICKENVMEGRWYAPSRGTSYSIPFVAYHGHGHRFTTAAVPASVDLTGRWKSSFEIGEPTEYPAIGVFAQDGNHLVGTFLTEIGDYRYLEGTVQGDKFYLSCFDGAHCFLFTGKINADKSLIGTFRNGSHHYTSWAATRDDQFKLKDPYSITVMKDDDKQIDFVFPNLSDKMISLNDDAFKEKNKIVQIMGSWCPNCKDEIIFLNEYLKNNQHENLVVLAIAFEKYRDKEKAFKVLRRYKKNMNIQYEVLYGGYFDKKEASNIFPSLNGVFSYPTLLFIDENNQVKNIYTGFSGPATGEYQDFKKEFDEIVNKMIHKDEKDIE